MLIKQIGGSAGRPCAIFSRFGSKKGVPAALTLKRVHGGRGWEVDRRQAADRVATARRVSACCAAKEDRDG